MTDEEMAEEWWNSWVVKDWNDLQEGKRLFIQAFLAGLKAGSPQWHDLRKDKTDLPQECGRYLVYVGGGENGVYPLDFDTEVNDFGYWCLDVGDNLGVRDTIFETITERNEDKVIAWKEIVLPELKESE